MMDIHTKDNLADTSMLLERQLHILAPDGVILGESLSTLKDAQNIFAAARTEAALLVQQAHKDAASIRSKAEADGQDWLERREHELNARLLLQQTQWLSMMEPSWMQALERTVRSLCGGLLRLDALAGAIAAGTKEFKDLSELRIEVHPDDLDTAGLALERLGKTVGLIRLNAESSVAFGSCRFRNNNVEVTLDLDSAINLALGTL
jgi:flagellar biosynthesis/type III secretory pathway protein FliH